MSWIGDMPLERVPCIKSPSLANYVQHQTWGQTSRILLTHILTQSQLSVQEVLDLQRLHTSGEFDTVEI